MKNKDVRIYEDYLNQADYTSAGTEYTDTTYYIKKYVRYDGNLYYLISENASSTRGVIGWVESEDLTSYRHVGVDRNKKTFYIKGVSHAYDTAWGSKQNISYENLSSLKGKAFTVNLTERVGTTLWYWGVVDGKTVWIRETSLSEEPLSTEKSTSRLGKLKNGDVRIYDNYADQGDYTEAGTSYTDITYYIKKYVRYDGNLYYLISESPSSTRGVLGWVKSKDLTSYKHVGVDRKAKTLYITGTSDAYDTAWGSKQNISYENLASLKGKAFTVNLTERVGITLWYRGVIDGKTAWIRETSLSEEPLFTEKSTSRLGKLKNGDVRIYDDYLNQTDYTSAGTEYTDTTYYIKKYVRYDGNLYYLISESPSSTRGVIGWIKSKDLTSYRHVGVDRSKKTFYIKGVSHAYDTAWGSKQNISYENLSSLKGEAFTVNLTERVGITLWYRGVIDGKTAWIRETGLSTRP